MRPIREIRVRRKPDRELSETDKSQAISYGRFLEKRKFYLKLCFLHAFTFYTRSGTELGTLFSEYLRSFGERYLGPFFFSPGAPFEFFTVLPLSETKNREEISSYISTVQLKTGPFF